MIEAGRDQERLATGAEEDQGVSAINGVSRFDGLSDSEVRRLNKFSSDINYVGIGSILLAISAGVAFFDGVDGREFNKLGMAFFSMFYALSAYSCFKRPAWGRLIGFFAAFSLIFAFPLGTFFGVVGSRALINGDRLFGNNRITNGELGELIVAIERHAYRQER